MDQRLLSWGLRRRDGLPRLWLFTDSVRLPDPLAAAARLPKGRAGVVFRHDDAPDRVAMGRALARICRARRLALVVAGDARLACLLSAGLHLRGGRHPGAVRPKPVGASRAKGRAITSSAHSLAELRRAARAGADLAFLSPAFPTASHAGAAGLGAARWAALARRAPLGLAVGALGGIDGLSVRRLPTPVCRAVGAIGALG